MSYFCDVAENLVKLKNKVKNKYHALRAYILRAWSPPGRPILYGGARNIQHNYYVSSSYVKKFYKFKCTESKATDKSDNHKSLQNRGF